MGSMKNGMEMETRKSRMVMASIKNGREHGEWWVL
jgi:hypothetical protein